FVMFFLIPNFLLTTGGVLSFAYAFILIMIDFETLSLLKRILFQTFSLSLGILPLLMWYFSSFQPLSILLTILFSFIFDNLMLPFLTLAYFLSPFVSLACFNPAFRLLERIILRL
ncbi:MAG: ComEC/Rec2 family competence protein, partial [Prevotella sp.]